MKKLGLLKMNLQYFADPAGGDGGGGGTDPVDPTNPNTDDPSSGGKGSDKDGGGGKKYTDAEVDAIVKRKKDKWKTEQEAQVEQAKKLAKMNADQKKDFELKQANKRAADAEAEATRLKMVKTARNMADEAGINVTEADLERLVTDNATSTKANLEWLKGLKERISADVKSDLLKGNSPKSGGSAGLTNKAGTYGEELAKMNHKSSSNPYFNEGGSK